MSKTRNRDGWTAMEFWWKRNFISEQTSDLYDRFRSGVHVKILKKMERRPQRLSVHVGPASWQVAPISCHLPFLFFTTSSLAHHSSSSSSSVYSPPPSPSPTLSLSDTPCVASPADPRNRPASDHRPVSLFRVNSDPCRLHQARAYYFLR